VDFELTINRIFSDVKEGTDLKPGRILALMVALALMLTLAGCKGSYFFSFKVEQSLENYSGTWYAVGEEDDKYFFQPGGANFQDSCFTSPKRFSGDFTLTVKFTLFADLTHRYSFGVALSSGYFYEPDPQDVLVWGVSNAGAEDDYIVDDKNDHGGFVRYSQEKAPVPGLVKDGYNEFVLTKTGDHFNMELNDELIAAFNFEYYESKWFIPTIYAYPQDAANTTYGFTLESVRVDYDGSIMNSPPPPVTP